MTVIKRMLLWFSFCLGTSFLFSSHALAQDFITRNDVDFRMPTEPLGLGLTVFWWNIGCSSDLRLGGLDETVKMNFTPESAWHNLSQLAESNKAPDVIVLGEYCPKFFDQSTYDTIKSHYPYVHRIVKTNDNFRIRNGFRVFSKTPISLVEELELPHGSFVSTFLPEMNCPTGDQSDFEWTRRYDILSIKKNNKDYHIAPVHFANPWKEVEACLGKLKTVTEIIFGETNVNSHQAKSLISQTQGLENLLVIGDFNAFKRFTFASSNTYNMLDQEFGPSLISSNNPTYVDSRTSFPNTSIDHAFSIGLEALYGEVLPLSGSDHLPILVEVN